MARFLENKKIETRTSFPLVHTMPMYKSKNLLLSNAKKLAETGICLPSSASLSKKDIKYVCDQIKYCFYK